MPSYTINQANVSQVNYAGGTDNVNEIKLVQNGVTTSVWKRGFTLLPTPITAQGYAVGDNNGSTYYCRMVHEDTEHDYNWKNDGIDTLYRYRNTVSVGDKRIDVNDTGIGGVTIWSKGRNIDPSSVTSILNSKFQHYSIRYGIGDYYHTNANGTVPIFWENLTVDGFGGLTGISCYGLRAAGARNNPRVINTTNGAYTSVERDSSWDDYRCHRQFDILIGESGGVYNIDLTPSGYGGKQGGLCFQNDISGLNSRVPTNLMVLGDTLTERSYHYSHFNSNRYHMRSLEEHLTKIRTKYSLDANEDFAMLSVYATAPNDKDVDDCDDGCG